MDHEAQSCACLLVRRASHRGTLHVFEMWEPTKGTLVEVDLTGEDPGLADAEVAVVINFKPMQKKVQVEYLHLIEDGRHEVQWVELDDVRPCPPQTPSGWHTKLSVNEIVEVQNDDRWWLAEVVNILPSGEGVKVICRDEEYDVDTAALRPLWFFDQQSASYLVQRHIGDTMPSRDKRYEPYEYVTRPRGRPRSDLDGNPMAWHPFSGTWVERCKDICACVNGDGVDGPNGPSQRAAPRSPTMRYTLMMR